LVAVLSLLSQIHWKKVCLGVMPASGSFGLAWVGVGAAVGAACPLGDWATAAGIVQEEEDGCSPVLSARLKSRTEIPRGMRRPVSEIGAEP
jgi:hypothetical protein